MLSKHDCHNSLFLQSSNNKKIFAAFSTIKILRVIWKVKFANVSSSIFLEKAEEKLLQDVENKSWKETAIDIYCARGIDLYLFPFITNSRCFWFITNSFVQFVFKIASINDELRALRQNLIKLSKFNLIPKLIFHDFQFYRLAKSEKSDRK